MCVRWCACACVYVCACVIVCAHVCVRWCTYVCMCVCACVHVGVCTCICARRCTCVCALAPHLAQRTSRASRCQGAAWPMTKAVVLATAVAAVAAAAAAAAGWPWGRVCTHLLLATCCAAGAQLQDIRMHADLRGPGGPGAARPAVLAQRTTYCVPQSPCMRLKSNPSQSMHPLPASTLTHWFASLTRLLQNVHSLSMFWQTSS